MPNLFKRKQVWFQVLVYSQFHKRRKPHSLKMAWHSPEFKDSTLANNFETLSPDTRLWELGAHFGERHISSANSPLQSAISIKLSPLLVFTVVVAPIIAIHKLQSHSILYLGPLAIYKFKSPFGFVITADGAIIYFLRLLFLAATATQLTKQCSIQSVVRTLLGSEKFSH